MIAILSAITLLLISSQNVATDILFSNEHEFEQQARYEREQKLSPEKVVRKLHRIVIDPGHGGFDSGAVNKERGLGEKDVTLPLALKLKRYLEERSDIEVFLTRTADYYVTLSDRTVTANQYQADLFLSIHCNAHENPSAHGFEVFFGSKEPSDREAARVAAIENRLGLDDPFFQEDNSINIESILSDLRRHQFLRESEQFASSINEGMKRNVDIRRRGVKSANFFVLRHAQMPAILVEVAFLTHAKEAELLTDEQFQDAVVRAIGEWLVEGNGDKEP